MAGACTFGRDKMAVPVQVSSPDLGSCTLEGHKKPYSALEKCNSGFEESSSSEEQEASQESDSYSSTPFIDVWKSLSAEKVHLSAEKTQKKGAQIRAKTAADQGNAEENKKAGQSKQNNGKSQTSNMARAVAGCSGRANPSNANGGGDNDDDDEGRKPRPSNLNKKKLDCDRPARQKSSSSEEMEWLPQDRVTPTKPGGGPEGLLPTRQNQQAVGKWFQDSNTQACHKAVVSMPSRSALTTGGVIRGGHPQQLNTRDPANSHGLHQGVLCHETGLLSYNMHPRVVSGELTAAQALEIVDRLCSTPDIGRDEPEPERKDVATGMPQHVPQTPFTCGPQGNSYLPPQHQDIPPAEQPEMSPSDLLVPGDVESDMEVDVPDGPETFNEGAFQGQPREVHSGTPSSGTSTSGFVSNSSWHTGDYQDSTFPMDTSTATPAGHEAVPPSSTHTIGSGEHQGDEAMEM